MQNEVHLHVAKPFPGSGTIILGVCHYPWCICLDSMSNEPSCSHRRCVALSEARWIGSSKELSKAESTM